MLALPGVGLRVQLEGQIWVMSGRRIVKRVNGPKGQARQLRSPALMPRSPSEVLEPTRALTRPKGGKGRREVRRLGPLLGLLNGFLTLIVVLLVVIGGGALWYDSQLDQAGPLKKQVSFVVRRGEGARDIARRLEESGIISSQYLFVGNYVVQSFGRSFGGKGINLQAGDYVFQPGTSVRQIASVIGEGRTQLMSVTIPEGLTSQQIVERLNKISSLSGEISVIPAEGSLMPDTYRVPRNGDRNKVLRLMEEKMQAFIVEAWSNRREGLGVTSPQEAIVLASIVEKETGRRDERERVAGVFNNRLLKGIRLQSDPTILYGIDKGKVSWGRPIYRSEINRKTDHNTYQIDGLPPTPICNPGRASIAAVLNPARTSELYFVADGQGGHIFSETLKDHNSAVANWRRIERELVAKRRESGSGATGVAGQAAPPPPAVLNAPETIKALAAGADLSVPLPSRKPRGAASGR